MEIIPLFSTPLYTTVLESLPEKEKNFIFNTKYKRSGWNNGDISTNTKILNLDECFEIRLIIEKELERFIDALGVRPNLEFCIKNSWVVRHHKNDWSQSHIHSNSLFSGVLYLKVDINSGNINFNMFLNAFSVGIFWGWIIFILRIVRSIINLFLRILCLKFLQFQSTKN